MPVRLIPTVIDSITNGSASKEERIVSQQASKNGSSNLKLVTLLLLIGAFGLIGAGTQACPRDRQSRLIPLGVSGGNIEDRSEGKCCGGTLGALVAKEKDFFILSNNHVMARVNKGTAGDGINQPGNIDVECKRTEADVVANLSEFRRIKFGFSSRNKVDAAIAKIRSGQVRTDGAILEIGQPSSSPLAPAIGLKVKKMGRTTGLTRGQISEINKKVAVAYPIKCGSSQKKTAVFVKQFEITPQAFSEPGDSGSLIVEDVSTFPHPVGLLFAGSDESTLANPIGKVLLAFGVIVVGSSSLASEEPSTAEGLTESAPEVAAAIAVQERYQDALLQIPGVVGVGIGQTEETGQVVIRVSVQRLTPELQRALPMDLEGIPVKIVVTGPYEASVCPVWSTPDNDSLHKQPSNLYYGQQDEKF